MRDRSKTISRAFKCAFPYTIPIFAGFCFLGMTYGIYAKTASGTNFIAFTTDKSYTYNASGNVSALIVKVEYRNFKNNASNGVSANVSIKGNEVDQTSSKLEVKVIGGNQTIQAGTYTEKGIQVTYDKKEITPEKITYSINGATPKTYTPSEIEKEINKLTSGTIKITYSVTYQVGGENTTKQATRTITIE